MRLKVKEFWGFKMKTKYKKIAIAVETGVITSLICSALPTFASDVELYKAPQSSQTTIMFMMDVSGSMNFCDNGLENSATSNKCRTGDTTRLDHLKSGMIKLLRGDTSVGIEPLPGKLVVGLSEFGGTTGRIKLEAKALDENENLGTKELYKIVTPITYTATRRQTMTATRNLTQTGTATKKDTGTSNFTQKATQTRSYSWSSWSSWSSWTPSEMLPTTWVQGSFPTPSFGGWNDPSWSGISSNDSTPSIDDTAGTSIVQICVDWESYSNDGNITCNTWENSQLSVAEVQQLGQLNRNNTASYSFNWSPSGNDGWTHTIVDGNVTENNSNSTPVTTFTSTPGRESSVENCTGYNNQNTCRQKTRQMTQSYERVTTKTTTQSKLQTRNSTRQQNASAVVDNTKVYTGTLKYKHRDKMIRAVNNLIAANGTPTAFAYAEVAAYLLGKNTSGNSSGFSSNVANISNATNYIKPATIDRTKQCNTQGIYFLTDGVPEYTNRVSAQSIMNEAISPITLTCSDTSLNQSGDFYGDNYQVQVCSWGGCWYENRKDTTSTNNWKCIASLNKQLISGRLVNNSPINNPEGVVIKTAVVGFGDIMAGKTSNLAYNNDIASAKKWGEIGLGGFYQGTKDQDIVESVIAFLKKMQKYIPPVTTGSVTVPVDNLDTQNIQPWGYFPQFDPQPDSRVTTWIGNLKKYEVVNNVLLDRDGKNIIDTTTKISVDDPNDFWADGSIKKTITKIKRVGTADIEEDIQVRIGGALSQFKLGVNASNNMERKIYTDRKIDEQTSVASNLSDDSNLVQVKTADLKSLNTANNFAKDPKRGYIASLFGYDVGATMASGLETDTSTAAQTNFANYLTNTNATLRQMGAVMHSKPVLITQSGTTSYNDKTGDLTYTDRDDLIVFGSTQGLLHIVRAGKTRTDSDAGKEVFTFMPNEMVDGQYQGFLNQTQQGNILKYGMDGQWTAYTEYVTKSGIKPTEPVVTVKGGKQWLYGGLRMGGKSYYALDLSNVTSDGGTPKLKFRIDPANSTNSAIRRMGQSWSKPTLTWVNWKGNRKLVMIVGGGYDIAYEGLTFNPSSSIDQGAGVYMFDANDGSLLWWSSANVASGSTSNTETYAANMKRSVVSQIKAVDRNNDGLADHLYFGDLGGQVWRVDFNASNKAGDTENIAKRVVRILDMSSAASVPRFYNTPTFTVHSSVNGYFGLVTIGSGNLSFPMSAANQNDALYVVYDKDVAKRNLSVLKENELSTVDVSTSGADGKKLVANTDGNTKVSLESGGWYYLLENKHRMLNDNVAIDNDLYVSVFDSTVDITDVDCIGGVRGKSVAKQFCLPFGQCLKKDNSGSNVPASRPDDIELGRGNIGISFGGIDKKRGLVLNLPTDKTLKSYQGKTKFISQRWYER